MKRLALHFGLLSLLWFVAVAPASAQVEPSQTADIPSMLPTLAVQRRVCPGDPPGNLASIDCAFTQKRRGIEFLGGSVTDQAVLGAAFFGTMAQIRHQPPEWDRDWKGLGQRVGSRYAQRLAKGAADTPSARSWETIPGISVAPAIHAPPAHAPAGAGFDMPSWTGS